VARSKTTVRVFAWQGDVAAVTDAWAVDLGFERGPSDDGVLEYWGQVQGTKETQVGGCYVTATQKEGQVELRFAIVTIGLTSMFTRRPSWFGIESGGFLWFLHRRRARVAANDLLARFGQPPVT
jgi:hypothetical protein